MNTKTLPGKFSGYVSAKGKKHVTTQNPEGNFFIPIIDVRDGDYARENAVMALKFSNRERGSMFFLDGNRFKIGRGSNVSNIKLNR